MSEHEQRMAALLYAIKSELEAERRTLVSLSSVIDPERVCEVTERIREIDGRVNEINFAVTPTGLVIDLALRPVAVPA